MHLVTMKGKCVSAGVQNAMLGGGVALLSVIGRLLASDDRRPSVKGGDARRQVGVLSGKEWRLKGGNTAV